MPQGYLFPLYNVHYWNGLISNSSAYPKFSWIDITIRPPGQGGAHRHWGELLAPAYHRANSPGHMQHSAATSLLLHII